MKRITTDINKHRPATSPRRASVSTFAELIDEWLEYLRIDGAKPKTLQDYQNKIDKFRWWWEVYPSAPDGSTYAERLGYHPEDVSVKEARAFVAYLRNPTTERWGVRSLVNPSRDILTPESILSYGRVVKAFFSWLAGEEQRYIERSPFNRYVKFASKHEKDKTIKTISQEDMDLIFDFLTHPLRLETFAGKRNLALIALLADSGIRRGELINLTIGDVDVHKRRCLVKGKTGTRVAFFGDKCRNALINYLQEPIMAGLKPTSPLWITVDGIPLTYNGVAGIIRKIEKQTGVDFFAHMFRHTFATHMAESGVLATDLMRMLGHENLTTTMYYLHDNPDHNQEIYRPNSPLDRQGKVEIRRRGRPKQ